MNRVMSRETLAVFILAFAARLVAVWYLGDLPISRSPQLDSLEYVLWAERIAADGFAWPAYPEHAPGYSFFVAAILMLSSGSLTAVRVIQAVIGSLSCVMTARIASRTLTPRAFLPAGLLQALYAPFLFLDTALLAEPLFIFLILASIDLAIRAGDRQSRWVWAGVFVGAASVVRPTGLVLILALGMAGLRERRIRHPLLVLLCGAALVVAPVVVQNWRVSGIPLIQAYGGMNFYLGNTPSSDGAARARLGGWWDTLEAEASRAGISRNDQDRYFMDRAWTEVVSSPAAYARLLANKAAWLTQQEELRDSHSIYFFRDALPLLSWLPGFGLIAALAASSLLARREWIDPWWLIWSLGSLALTVLFLVVGLRYRAPLVPLVIAFAGAGIVHLVDRVRGRAWSRVAMAAAIVTVVFAAANSRTDAASRNLAEEWALTGLSLQSEGELVRADEAFRSAISWDPRSSLAWDGLGMTLQRQGRVDEATSAYVRAVEINDSNSLAWYHLGLLREESRDLPGAVAAYRRANGIAPERTEFIAALGRALLQQGMTTDAEPFLRTAAERGDAASYVALAISAMNRGDAIAAMREAREATKLAPESGRAWELLARAATAARQPGEGQRALANAVRLGLDPREAARISAVLAAMQP